MVNRHVETAAVNWRNFKYMVFDIPNHSGTYQERYTALGIVHTLTCTLMLTYWTVVSELC